MAGFAAIAAAGKSIERLLNVCFEESQPIEGKITHAVLVRTDDFSDKTSPMPSVRRRCRSSCTASRRGHDWRQARAGAHVFHRAAQHGDRAVPGLAVAPGFEPKVSALFTHMVALSNWRTAVVPVGT